MKGRPPRIMVLHLAKRAPLPGMYATDSASMLSNALNLIAVAEQEQKEKELDEKMHNKFKAKEARAQ